MNNSPINDFVRKAKQTSSDVSEELQSKMETASAHTETLVMQVDEKLGETKSVWYKARQEYPVEIVTAATVGAFALSLPFGKFVTLRNTAMIGGLSSFLTNPVSTVSYVKPYYNQYFKCNGCKSLPALDDE